MSALRNIGLRQLSWSMIHKHTLASIHDSLRKEARLDAQKDDYVVRVYTAGSKEFCATVLTRTKEEQPQQKIGEQQHEALGFLEGRFIGAQKN